MSKPCPTCNSVMRPVGAGSCPTCGQDSDAIRSIFAARDRLDSVEARYKDLLDQLGVQGHDGATAEIAALRSLASLAPAAPTPQGMDAIPEYFAKPGIVENLAAAHPVMLVRQMANEILRQRSASAARKGVFVPQDVWDWLMGEGPDFDPTPEQVKGPFGAGRYWWRSELRRRVDSALSSTTARDAEDAERWRAFCNLWAASTELKVAQDESGSWSIMQVEDVEGETFKRLVGETPDATIDLARSATEATEAKP